jgi:hypothetical protein
MGKQRRRMLVIEIRELTRPDAPATDRFITNTHGQIHHQHAEHYSRGQTRQGKVAALSQNVRGQAGGELVLDDKPRARR